MIKKIISYWKKEINITKQQKNELLIQNLKINTNLEFCGNKFCLCYKIGLLFPNLLFSDNIKKMLLNNIKINDMFLNKKFIQYKKKIDKIIKLICIKKWLLFLFFYKIKNKNNKNIIFNNISLIFLNKNRKNYFCKFSKNNILKQKKYYLIILLSDQKNNFNVYINDKINNANILFWSFLTNYNSINVLIKLSLCKTIIDLNNNIKTNINNSYCLIKTDFLLKKTVLKNVIDISIQKNTYNTIGIQDNKVLILNNSSVFMLPKLKVKSNLVNKLEHSFNCIILSIYNNFFYLRNIKNINLIKKAIQKEYERKITKSFI